MWSLTRQAGQTDSISTGDPTKQIRPAGDACRQPSMLRSLPTGLMRAHTQYYV